MLPGVNLVFFDVLLFVSKGRCGRPFAQAQIAGHDTASDEAGGGGGGAPKRYPGLGRRPFMPHSHAGIF